MVNLSPLHQIPIDGFLQFTDAEIGQGYFKEKHLQPLIRQSQWQGQSLSYFASDKNQVVGLRLTISPDHLLDNLPTGQSPLTTQLDQVAYFKSCYVAKSHRGQGLATQLSQQSLAVLKSLGAKGVLTHSWKESPKPSMGYLTRLGFKPQGEIAQFWSQINYVCPRCGPPPCRCTAIELLLTFK